MNRHRPHISPADYQIFVPTRRDSMDRLKLEVDVAIDKNFWGNPKKPWRPKTDPGAGGFRLFHITFGRKLC